MRPTLFLMILLILASAAGAQERPLPPMPAKVLDWKATAPYADQFISDGDTIRLIRQDGVTVAIFGYTSGDYLIAEVTVANGTESRATVKPEDFFITYWDEKKKFGYVYSLPPEKIANKLRSRAKWGNFFRSFAAGMAQTTTTETGSVSVYGTGGSASGTYSGTTTSPDRAGQARAAEANRRTSVAADARAADIISSALKANTVFPKTYVSGLVYFPRKKFQLGVLYLIIDGTGYTFAFGPSKK